MPSSSLICLSPYRLVASLRPFPHGLMEIFSFSLSPCFRLQLTSQAN